MPLDALHGRIASIALRAAARFGFALGGGNALIAHGVVDRLTRDVDLVTDRETGVLAAKGPVEEALRREGFAMQRRDLASGLADLFPDWEEAAADWHVTAPNGRRTDLEMVYFDRSREPVLMDVGPVLHLEDAAGNKVCALAGRVEPRDYVDTAALLGRWNPAKLIGFARRLDPGLMDSDYAAAAQRLDRMPDEKFTPFWLTGQAVAALRERFAAWPRDARAVSRLQGSSRDIGDSTAARNGREKHGQAREQLPDREASGRAGQTDADRDQDRAIRSPDRLRKEPRERVRDNEWEIDRLRFGALSATSRRASWRVLVFPDSEQRVSRQGRVIRHLTSCDEPQEVVAREPGMDHVLLFALTLGLAMCQTGGDESVEALAARSL